MGLLKEYLLKDRGNMFKTLKARTFFSFMIYASWLSLTLQGCDVPELLQNMVVAQMAFYFGTKGAST